MTRFARFPSTLRLFALGAIAVLGTTVVACGGGGYGGGDDDTQLPTQSPGSTPGATSAEVVATRDVTGVGNILVTLDGFTLYTFSKDAPNTSNCSGDCAESFPPLASTEDEVAKPAGANGTFSLVTREDGTKQVVVDGHPLYRYVGDRAAGEAKGQGFNGLWFAAPASGVTAAAAGGGDPGSAAAESPTPTQQPAQQGTTPAPQSATPTQRPAPQAVSINVNDNRFEPANQTVSTGTTIRWVWVGGNSHSIVGTFNGQAVESQTQTSGEFEFTPTTAGVFEYICGVHGVSMSGKVTVQ